MTARCVLALGAAACCVMLGAVSARRLSQRTEALNAWDGALIRMEGAVTHLGAATVRVLEIGAGDDVPLLDDLAEDMRARPGDTPRERVKALAFPALLSSQETAILRDCLQGLFLPTLGQQAQAIALAREQWTPRLLQARSDQAAKNRLYRGLGWLAGAAAFILLC